MRKQIHNNDWENVIIFRTRLNIGEIYIHTYIAGYSDVAHFQLLRRLCDTFLSTKLLYFTHNDTRQSLQQRGGLSSDLSPIRKTGPYSALGLF